MVRAENLPYVLSMRGIMELNLIVLPESDEEQDDVARWSTRLINELLGLDSVIAASPAGELSAEPLDGIKGTGSLTRILVQIPAAGLGVLVQFLRTWVSLTGREVEASIDGDPIHIQGASKEQVDQVMAAWIASHRPGT
jgi:hypothetical protein